VNLLSTAREAIEVDWEALNCTPSRVLNYIGTTFFLIKIFATWIFFGWMAKYSFPFRAISSLIQHSFHGDLGDEISTQQVFIRKCRGELRDGNYDKAEKINKIDSHYWLILELINQLCPTKVSDSISRIFHTVEVLDQERVEVLALKTSTAYQFDKWEFIKNGWKNAFLIGLSRNELEYRTMNDIFSDLIFNYYSSIEIMQYTICDLLKNTPKNLRENTKISIFVLEVLVSRLVLDFTEASVLLELSVKQIKTSLDQEIQKNPRLRLLRKTRILMGLASETFGENELIIGKPVRVKRNPSSQGRNKYHFHRACDRYPKREKAEDIDLILLYDTREDAEKDGYEACNICCEKVKKAGKKRDRTSRTKGD
jgi:hypothetical protein